MLSMNRPSAERGPMQELVKARATYDQVAGKLPDESLELSTLVQDEGAGGEAAVGAPLSFEEDIDPLFREKDIEEMKDVAGFDLSDYDDVRENAEPIYVRLDDGTMPCDGPWPEEDVETFRRWIDQGKQP